jgi:hypothetical protein
MMLHLLTLALDRLTPLAFVLALAFLTLNHSKFTVTRL